MRVIRYLSTVVTIRFDSIQQIQDPPLCKMQSPRAKQDWNRRYQRREGRAAKVLEAICSKEEKGFQSWSPWTSFDRSCPAIIRSATPTSFNISHSHSQPTLDLGPPSNMRLLSLLSLAFTFAIVTLLSTASPTSAHSLVARGGCSGGVHVCCGSTSVGCSGNVCKACCGNTCGCFYERGGTCSSDPNVTPCVDVCVDYFGSQIFHSVSF